MTIRIIIFVFFVLTLFGCGEQGNSQSENKTSTLMDDVSHDYVGAERCKDCHQEQYSFWKGSHHDLAMQEANAETVLGDFNNASFEYFGITSNFYKKDHHYFVETDGPDGELTEYLVAYVFGVYPLQQYLIEFSRGRYQVLSIAWDAREKHKGGQRWYHLYPDEAITYNDDLHWTGINQNWNYMCADCHSTHLQKNYNQKSLSYDTTWSEIDVSCEACHGPGSNHIAWSKKPEIDKTIHKGLSVVFNERDAVSWQIDSGSGNAKRSAEKHSDVEIEVCAQCHARRARLRENVKAGDDFLDGFQVSLLTEPLYHADGQIKGEVYVYGSFLQSKMYHAGVTCSDCHEPHSLGLRVEGDALCLRCHEQAKYDSALHHLHQPGTETPSCVNCHMPSKDYMGVDTRHDHSFRVPRPDLSLSMGVPNVCTQCHQKKTHQWAADELLAAFGEANTGHYAEALHAGRNGLPLAEELLSQLIGDKSQPAITRASAITLLPRYLSNHSAQLLQSMANEEEALMGLGLAFALRDIPEEYRLSFASPLLDHDLLSIRSLAASELSHAAMRGLPAKVKAQYDSAIKDYVTLQSFNADRPESLLNLASYYASNGLSQKALPLYKNAISIAPYYIPAYINFSDYYRAMGDETSAEALLRQGLLLVRDKTSIQHALGLLLVRKKNIDAAIEFLRLAAESNTTTSRFVYVYAIALNTLGKKIKAVEVLENAYKEYPQNREILRALVSIYRELEKSEQAQRYESILKSLK